MSIQGFKYYESKGFISLELIQKSNYKVAIAKYRKKLNSVKFVRNRGSFLKSKFTSQCE